MIKNVIIKKLNKNIDERGWLAEIFRNDEIDYDPSMGYISVTKPGIVRGPHEHKEQSDCFVFTGPGNFMVYLWDRREDSETKSEKMEIEVGENNPSLVIVPPGIVHGYKCVGDKDAYCLNLPNRLYKGERKQEEVDEVRWELDNNSPYKIL